jgi:signal transduction histidine kinase
LSFIFAENAGAEHDGVIKTSARGQLGSQEARWNGLRTLLLTCFVFLLCYLTAELGGALVVHVPRPVWLLWPGCAILTAVLLMAPRTLWPVLLPAGLAGFVLYDLRAGVALVSILWLILVDAAEILTATLGVHSVFGGEPRLGDIKGLAKYCLFAVILAPFVTAVMGAAIPRGNYWISWRIIFFSEALAFLTLPPAILGWANQLRHGREKSAARWLEAFTLIIGVFLLGYVLSVTSEPSLTPALFYALVPFLIWSALRFGPSGVSTSIIIVAFLSIRGSIHGRGPFAGATPLQNVLSLQLFLLCAAIPFTLLAALAEEHKYVEAALRELSGRLITAQEEERARLSRDLHDDLSQRMARLLIRLERCRQGIGDMAPKLCQQLDAMVEMASEVSADLRDLSHLLHPATLATLGLVTSIAGFCRKFSEQHNLGVNFEFSDIPKDTPEDVSLCLFRIVQEALSNVVKHSAAQEARVILTGSADRIDLRIEDSGMGFNPQSSQGTETLGLISMQARVRLVGGQFSIESEPSSGTRIHVQVPISRIAAQPRNP